uniref:Ig-like domain-containing protein n=1 Tax=Anguilla anguilla TaxID=7936 RepID=A0A0E9WZV6_ANGAN
MRFFCVLLAQLAASPVYSVRMFVNIGHSLTLACRGDPSRDVEWRFQQYGYPDWLDVAELYTGSFSSGNGFQGRVESFYLKDPGNYSLLLGPVVYSDLGIYKCQYRDETEIVLSDVKLDIRVPTDVSVAMGMSASLPCFGKMNMQALLMIWISSGREVERTFTSSLRIPSHMGPGSRTELQFPQNKPSMETCLSPSDRRFSDEGDYQCFYNSPKENCFHVAEKRMTIHHIQKLSHNCGHLNLRCSCTPKNHNSSGNYAAMRHVKI